MSTASRIFVTGGSGFVGGHLIPALIADGHHVFALARSDRSAARVEALGAQPVRGSLGTVAPRDLQGIDAIIHAAAKVEDWGDPADFEAVNVDGTRQLLDAARAARVTRFIHVSSEAVHFTGKDLVDIDENTPLAVDSPFAYSASKARAEQLVQAANSDTLATIVLRPRIIWGPGDTTILPELEKAVADGAFAWMDGGGQQISTTHVANLVDAICTAVDRAPGGTVAFVVDSERHTARSFFTAYASAAGLTLPGRSLPSWLLRGTASLLAAAWTTFGIRGRPPITPFAANMLSATLTIRSTRAAEVMNWAPVVDFEHGLAQVRRAA